MEISIRTDGIGIFVTNAEDEQLARVVLDADEIYAVEQAFETAEFWGLFLQSVKDSIINED